MKIRHNLAKLQETECVFFYIRYAKKTTLNYYDDNNFYMKQYIISELIHDKIAKPNPL